MVKKSYWKKSIEEFSNVIRQTKRKKSLKVLNVSFVVLPNVFSPIYSSDTTWFAEKLMSIAYKKDFLEIGSGSGIIACLAALNGARRVVATDINPAAVDNTKANAQLHFLNVDVRLGNMFDPISGNEKFDVIFWNHPFYCLTDKTENHDMVALSVYDPDYQSLVKFFLHGKSYLKNNGSLFLGTSNIARINIIKRYAKENGYKTKLVSKIEKPVYKGKKMKMDLRIYSFTPELYRS